MDVDIEQDDLNQKFLTSLAPEWLMHTIVWRNRSDLDTMSLDDLYIHLKVYESEVQKKSKPNSMNMAFISSAKHNRGNEDVNTASVFTASTNVPTASANIGEVIEFGDSYEVPASTTSTTTKDTTSDRTGKKKGRTVTLTVEDIQKRKNAVKARTTLLLSLTDEHQLRFSRYKTTQELWAAILKTFGGNEATKKTKKNLLKQQYGNFKVE
nr:ribonuclease H-like domain-containing protein [Tanacetum cinerariifolium]